ncbi:Ger(x)C family spore germination protein [Paenibacillus silvisoli]|uniref:Ger(x)C family spore germination protein n=1 Tax=Paenibacillus silvisoli TaxID=3110539 RepID=UPI002804A3F3|nr:Ger(x)C family spore germination protein [Paenibacillus silvisoli]
MRNGIAKLLLTMLLASILGGCGDTTDLSAQSFVTSMGIDFQEGKYVVSVQLMDFSSIAKSESPKSTKPSVWIGVGKGRSINAAVNQIAVTTQSTLNFDQLKVVIVREPAMDKMKEILDSVNRVRVTRFTIWMYGTRGSMIDIMTSSSFFKLSQMYSLIFDPIASAKQNSTIEPVKMQKFVQEYNEYAVTALLPSVSVTKAVWHENEAPITVQQFDGVFAFKLQRKPVFLSVDQALGTRWLSKRFYRANYTVQQEERQYTSAVAISDMKAKKRIASSKNGFKFVIDLNARGLLTEQGGGNQTLTEIEAKVRKRIEDELKQTFVNGIRKKVDLFNFEETLYRFHNKEWKKLASDKNWLPDENDIQLNVSFSIKNSGVFEME